MYLFIWDNFCYYKLKKKNWLHIHFIFVGFNENYFTIDEYAYILNFKANIFLFFIYIK